MKKWRIQDLPKVAHALLKVFPQLRTVSDATRNVEVDVTASDRRARIKNPASCAMAQACKREQNADGAYIRLGTAYLIRGTHATRYIVPQRVTREIVSFDRKGGFEPGTYTLNAPVLSQKLGVRSPNRNGVEDGSRPSRVHRVVKRRHRTLNVRAA